jgi:hypothetical protein
MTRRAETNEERNNDTIQPIATSQDDAHVERVLSRANTAAVDAGPVATVGEQIARKKFMTVFMANGTIYSFRPSQIGMTTEQILELADEQVLQRRIDDLSEVMYSTYAEFAMSYPMGSA